MKKKYFKKDKKVAKKSKTQKNSKKIVKAKKAARRVNVKIEFMADAVATVPHIEIPTREEIVTLGFESSAAEPEALAGRADEAHEPIPGDPTEAV